ncbi:MAG: hypothetical protein HC906_01295 [Bacteroidales bacterium]|nr:hypothetical protein [Bacteroidales bacterium]
MTFISLKKNTFWGNLTLKNIETETGPIILARINKVTEYVYASELLDKLVKQTGKFSGQDFFKEVSRLLAETFEVKSVLIASIHEENRDYSNTLVFWTEDHYSENFSFRLSNSPNSNVIKGITTLYPSNLNDLFPEYSVFNVMQAQSYFGCPIFKANGQVMGIIALLDDKPMVEKTNARHILSVIASRAGAEMEKIKAEEKTSGND